MAAGFSEEDLTRYLQLSLDLFRDLQFSLQPRFHLEIGLVRLVQAGRLLPIEQALAGLGRRRRRPPSAAGAARRAPSRLHRRAASRATGPSPFELDRAKKARSARPSRSPPAPMRWRPNRSAPPSRWPSGDWRQRLHTALHGTRHAVHRRRHRECPRGRSQRRTAVHGEPSNSLALRPEDLNKAIQQISGRPMRIKVTVGDAGAPRRAADRAEAAGQRGRCHQPRAGQSRSPAVPRSLRR